MLFVFSADDAAQNQVVYQIHYKQYFASRKTHHACCISFNRAPSIFPKLHPVESQLTRRDKTVHLQSFCYWAVSRCLSLKIFQPAKRNTICFSVCVVHMERCCHTLGEALFDARILLRNLDFQRRYFGPIPDPSGSMQDILVFRSQIPGTLWAGKLGARGSKTCRRQAFLSFLSAAAAAPAT